MKLKMPRFLKKTNSAESRSAPENKKPSPSPKPAPSPQTVQEIGAKFMELTKKRGDKIQDIMLQALTSYEDGSLSDPHAKPAEPRSAAPSPQATVDYFDGMTKSFESMTDHITAVDKFKDTIRGSMPDEDEYEEEEAPEGILDTLKSIGVTDEQVQTVLAKLGESLKGSTPSQSEERHYG